MRFLLLSKEVLRNPFTSPSCLACLSAVGESVLIVNYKEPSSENVRIKFIL
jgi:hypothetical protein